MPTNTPHPKPVPASIWLCSRCGSLHIAAFLACPLVCCGAKTLRNGICYVHARRDLAVPPHRKQECDGCKRGFAEHELEPVGGTVDRWLCPDCTRYP